jgi:hypothetical protein
MGLGKTVQAIAAMSSYRNSDWPLLVLCPSSARYHWEVEFRHWMGSESTKMGEEMMAMMGDSMEEGNPIDVNTSNGKLVASTSTTMTQKEPKSDDSILTNDQINVLTSGRDAILKGDGSTRVVICSIGLIVNLVDLNRIRPGMFKAIIVDVSHLLSLVYIMSLHDANIVNPQ